MNNELLKEYVINNFDPDDVLDALGITTEQLLEAFPEELEQNGYKFVTYEEIEDNEDN
jgi:hypothetical protein